ncbi:hypothetical protein FLA4_10280 [Candidatus Rickettsia kotlanii]|nr:hypothetical protein FLA4_10280 [Candidatus Rickettsia kotlanii]BDU61861.1 hypothetical protein HM2_10290 [Candidatus Rickettsia kotlanii]
MASPSLLRPGLSHFSYEAAFQRQDFTIYNNADKYLVLNTDYMLGMNDYLTSGGHFEFLKNHEAVVVTNNLKIRNFSIIDISTANNIKISVALKELIAAILMNRNILILIVIIRTYITIPIKFSQVSIIRFHSCGNTDFGNISVNF